MTAAVIYPTMTVLPVMEPAASAAGPDAPRVRIYQVVDHPDAPMSERQGRWRAVVIKSNRPGITAATHTLRGSYPTETAALAAARAAVQKPQTQPAPRPSR